MILVALTGAAGVSSEAVGTTAGVSLEVRLYHDDRLVGGGLTWLTSGTASGTVEGIPYTITATSGNPDSVQLDGDFTPAGGSLQSITRPWTGRGMCSEVSYQGWRLELGESGYQRPGRSRQYWREAVIVLGLIGGLLLWQVFYSSARSSNDVT